ncbi:non-ribosomal peptide synthetase/type I polyketide synthase [Leptolyngbya sp. FACHB-16]|uniref:non-ribosomal peptide synthetase/type I polyketide synthase n=1 Tax=unclassified Leptolyngbya TaxID=2650499 RepID=UPI0016841624|nr:non-ribosomal peptide synthetase/type I polyketide synthase [Leptolyngbya sp. FACHB-16]MBD2158899.1 amino acid adenylation domain-containing protein [Leptolyngbya sp. FACHB-16]
MDYPFCNQELQCSTLVELLHWRATCQATQHAFTFLAEGEEQSSCMTYGDLDHQARAIAYKLQSYGADGERVLLLYPPSLDFIAAFFGCLYLGYVAIPAYPPRSSRSTARIKSIIADARPTIVLTTKAVFPVFKKYLFQLPEIRPLAWIETDHLVEDAEYSLKNPAINSNTLAYLQYTSGSTSVPKGVMVNHKNVLHNSEYIRQAFQLTTNSVSVSWLPHFHDMGLVDGIIQPLYTGFTGYLMAPSAFLQKPYRWLQAISHSGATHSGAPNFAYELCINKINQEQKKSLALSHWASAYNGAEPIRSATLERFIAEFEVCGFRAASFYPCYGLAEATLMVSGGSINQLPEKCTVEEKVLVNHRVEVTSSGKEKKYLISCGRSHLDTVIIIANPELRTRCAPTEVGEIWISGASVAQGYWEKPEETQQTFHAYLVDTGEGPFLRTGDLGFIQDGELFVTGRLKDLLIIRGRNHYPQDLELTVEQSHPALHSNYSAAIQMFMAGEERLVVFQEIERSYLRKLDIEEVAGAIRQAVAEEHELQVYCVVLLKPGSIPKTSSGKIQRHACRTSFTEGTLSEVGRSVLQQVDIEQATELSRKELLAITPETTQQQLLYLLKKQVARLLRVPSSQLDPQQPLNRLGIDSLMAFECKHYFNSIGLTVEISDFLQGVSLAHLATKLWESMQYSISQASTECIPLPEPPTEYPLSQGQLALWFQQQLTPQSSAYNTVFAARILSPVNVPILRQVFEVLSDRHFSLRTTFSTTNGQPIQRVRHDLSIPFEEIDATTWKQNELDTQLATLVNCVFDLEYELPVRVSLFHCGNENILLLTAHHIAIDFWSLELLLNEISSLYSHRQRAMPDLPKLDWHYADYVRWQAALLASDQGNRSWRYWQEQLSGELPVLALPTDRPRSSIQTYQGGVHLFSLNQNLLKKLNKLARREGVTLYVLLLTTFQVLLHRYTRQEDILVGSPMAGRKQMEWANVVGYFVNPVALRVNLSQNPTFKALLGQVQQVVLQALEHQDYPLSLLIKKLQPERDLSYSPLFQTMFVLEQARQIENLAAFWAGSNDYQINLGELRLESIPIDQPGASLDLTLTVLETETELLSVWQYNRNLFDAGTIARMAEHFHNLLAGIVAELCTPIQELPLISAVERQKLLVKWNGTDYEYPQDLCIHQLFEKQKERTPHAIAVVFETQQISYQELNERANQLAHYLKKIGVNTETLVGIYLERSIEMLVGLLGVLKAGAAYVPLDPGYPQARLISILSDAQLSVLLTSENLEINLSKHNATVIALDRDGNAIKQQNRSNPDIDIKPFNLAYILYTSGSTGQPKGVAIEHRSTVNFLHWARSIYTAEQLAGVLASTSINFDLSVFELFAPLCWGGQVILAENALHLPTLPAAEKVTLLNTVPSVMAELLRMEGIPDGVQVFNLAGEPLSNQLVKRLYKHWPDAQIFNLYGPTEATTYSTFTPVVEGEHSPTIGHPIANTQIYILDNHLQPVPIGIVGELYIGGAGLSREYLNRFDLTTEKFVPNPFSDQATTRLYRTGDLARYLSDGSIEFKGRCDHQVKVRGFRIELDEIHAVLMQHPMVQDAIALVQQKPDEQSLIAYVVPRQTQSVLHELRYFLKQKLPQYMIPSVFLSLDSLPLSPNGKIDKHALLSMQAQPQKISAYNLPQTNTEQAITLIWKELLQLEEISIYDNFFDLGGHSLLLVQVHRALQKHFHRDISIIDLFKYPTIYDLAKYITLQRSEKIVPESIQSKGQHQNLQNPYTEIAIVGMSCRFPGAPDIATFWKNLQEGVESISFFSDEELQAAGVEPDVFHQANYINSKAVLPDIEKFDAEFFGFSPKQAQVLDPQHRLFLEASWKALENAGYSPQSTRKIGVYAGVGTNTYLLNNLHQNSEILDSVGEYQLLIGNDKDFLPTRISYKLNLDGPSVNVQTACSTSLVAVHLACQSLHNRECDMALAGGVSIRLPQQSGYLYQEGMILSPDGRCRAFDAQAQGTVPGNGLGVIVLKRLADAIAHKDCIYAVIKGSAINNDGSAKVGYTAPSVNGQASVIAAAQAIAGVTPDSITYIEAHGTGTVLGDPIEMAALTQAFQESTRKGFCAVGSVKTNIGHLDAAAGIAGLMKTVLSLKHKQLFPSLHFENPNPQIDFANSPFYVSTQLHEWKTDGIPRRAGVSAFGIGGTNCHIVLEEVSEELHDAEQNNHEDTVERPLHLLTLSAKSEKALKQLKSRYQEYFSNFCEAKLADVCFTANVGRSHFNHRLALIGESSSQLYEQLAVDSHTSELLMGMNHHSSNIAFLFTGQGSQYAGMGQQLYETQPTFRAVIDQCQEILHPYLDVSLLRILSGATLIDQTAYTQPALFSLEYALYQLWKSWGISPEVVMGHSLGEYVAACVAGVFSLEDALKLVAARGQLMQSLPSGGEMVAVFASEDRVQETIHVNGEDVAIAAINTPNSIVISGKSGSLTTLIANLHSQGIEIKKLAVSHAFHSPLMQPILPQFEQIAQQVNYTPPNLKIISNVTGEIITEEIATPQYWCRHLQQPVQFATGMKTLGQLGNKVFIEIGPKPTLLAMGRQCLLEKDGLWLPSLHPEASNWQQLLESLSKLYMSGVDVDWSGFDRDYGRRRVALPTYPFQRQRYWVEPPARKFKEQEPISTTITDLLNQGKVEQITSLLEKNHSFSPEQKALLPDLLSALVKQHQQELTAASSENWFYQLEWQVKPRHSSPSESTQISDPGTWLIFADQQGIGEEVAKRLEDEGYQCWIISADHTLHSEQRTTWILDPLQQTHFETLLQTNLSSVDLPLKGIIHLWSLDAAPTENLTLPSSLEQAQILNCASVLHLLQALIKHPELGSPKLWLVTRGAVSELPDSKPLAIAQAPLWGLGKVIAIEHTQLWGGLIDIPSDASLDDITTNLLAEFVGPEGEDHLAFREGQRYVSRLKPSPVSLSPTPGFRKDSSYLITGGLGALGMKTARWMVEQGAKHLVLISRQEVLTEHEFLSQLEQMDVKLFIAQADVSLQEDMEKVFEEIEATMPPLRGVFHLAGTLNDGTLQRQDWKCFTRALKPKVQGAWNLHTLTQNLPLDFFVLFSSAASLLGSPGQGNYAAANAFLDSLAHYRRGLGLPGLSINWGQWTEAGMSANLSCYQKSRLTAQGLSTIAPEQGLQILGSLIQGDLTQVGVLPINWSLFQQKLPLVSNLVDEIGSSRSQEQTLKRYEFLESLKQASIGDRPHLLIDHLQTQTAQVLGLPPSQVRFDQGFADMGLDSLMAIEFRSRIENSLNISMPTALIFEHPTIKNLATFIGTHFFRWQEVKPELSKADKLEPVISEVEQLTEAEVQTEIARELAELESLIKKTDI